MRDKSTKGTTEVSPVASGFITHKSAGNPEWQAEVATDVKQPWQYAYPVLHLQMLNEANDGWPYHGSRAARILCGLG